MAAKKEKSPYGEHSIEDIMKTEAGNYYIQVGDTMFESESGKLAFSKARAEDFFVQILEGLIDLRKHGSEEDKEDALRCMLSMRIIPLRFH